MANTMIIYIIDIYHGFVCILKAGRVIVSCLCLYFMSSCFGSIFLIFSLVVVYSQSGCFASKVCCTELNISHTILSTHS